MSKVFIVNEGSKWKFLTLPETSIDYQIIKVLRASINVLKS
jgi:hypothetical protein